MQEINTIAETKTIAPRSPDEVMRLARMGSFHPMRLSFSRILLRRMAEEDWTIDVPDWSIDENGYGHAVITATTPHHTYSLAAFSHKMDNQDRSDRVIAEKWDATFSLVDGYPDDAAIKEMSQTVSKQEAGRHRADQLTLSRANKSVRIFDHVVERLSQGRQPDAALINKIGYIMRTTAVYGNGKFGIGDRDRIITRPEMQAPFQVEMLTVYLIRVFSLKLVNHLAKMAEKNEGDAVSLNADLARHLGIGNATGLGMAPFLVHHQALLNQWMITREMALARVLSQETISADDAAKIELCLNRAIAYTAEWRVDDVVQSDKIVVLEADLQKLSSWLSGNWWSGTMPLKQLMDRARETLSLEAEEMLVSILMEPFGILVDDLADQMSVHETFSGPTGMKVADVRDHVRQHYAWVFDIDLDDKAQSALFWYTSEAKLEPRLGRRHEESGADREMPFDIPKQVRAMMADIDQADADQSLAAFMMVYPQHRFVLKRVMTTARYPYGEIKENLVAESMRPIDMLRCKLSFFGASKFDPKSILWTRIALFQGAPLAEELNMETADHWLFPSIGAVSS
jgi:hypothetical protein